MKKVAVFGNAGGGKSMLSKRLAAMTGLPLVALDLLKYRPGGGQVPDKEYKAAHDKLLQQDRWIIDGYGSLDTVWKRLEVADTLVYLDMPVLLHYWWVTKRFLTGFLVPPEGWPENSPLLKGTLNSYYTVWLCHQKLTPRYREYVNNVKGNANSSQKIHHLKSPKDIERFFKLIEGELTKQEI
ncbi:MAG: adenylate kinase [Cyanobacteria bacterium SID2]|nr:adenylate kinase [Cyanobacteria bacterium SID2]MBP0005376.1 adenylate kinase [Cyanobacteria bacterium SBC]